MRQVDHDELAWKIVMALRHVARSTWKAATDPRHEVSDRAVASIADKATEGLRGLEILTDAPVTSAETFSRPMARMRGEAVASGAPAAELER